MSAHDKLMRDIHLDDLRKAEQALAACAYWAANGLREKADRTNSPTDESLATQVMLENILKESKEYAESEPGRDSNIMYDGFEYTYTPIGGWLEPKKESM